MSTAAALRRYIDRHGRDVTHQTFTASADNSRGRTTGSYSSTTVTAVVEPRSDERIIRGPAGDERRVELELLLKDTVTVEDGHGGTPDIFTVDGVDYEAAAAIDEANGAVRVLAVRKRS